MGQVSYTRCTMVRKISAKEISRISKITTKQIKFLSFKVTFPLKHNRTDEWKNNYGIFKHYLNEAGAKCSEKLLKWKNKFTHNKKSNALYCLTRRQADKNKRNGWDESQERKTSLFFQNVAYIRTDKRTDGHFKFGSFATKKVKMLKNSLFLSYAFYIT